MEGDQAQPIPSPFQIADLNREPTEKPGLTNRVFDLIQHETGMRSCVIITLPEPSLKRGGRLQFRIGAAGVDFDALPETLELLARVLRAGGADVSELPKHKSQ